MKAFHKILHCQKPAGIAAGIIALLCIAAGILLFVNLRGNNTKQSEQYVYGVIIDSIISSTLHPVVMIPGIGEVEIPDAEEIDAGNSGGLRIGDIVKITFPGGADLSPAETYPARFITPAARIKTLGGNFWLFGSGTDPHLLSIPPELVPDARAGDLLEIYLHDGKELLAGVPILSVNESKIEIKLSLQETQLFLSEQETGVTYNLISQAE